MRIRKSPIHIELQQAALSIRQLAEGRDNQPVKPDFPSGHASQATRYVPQKPNTSDRDYAIVKLPKELKNATMLVRTSFSFITCRR